jgi:hypothetical protein
MAPFTLNEPGDERGRPTCRRDAVEFAGAPRGENNDPVTIPGSAASIGRRRQTSWALAGEVDRPEMTLSEET